MQFSSPVRAPEGLSSYAKVNRVRPVLTLINLIEAAFALLGVVMLILLIRYGSFEKAGQVIDHSLGCLHTCVINLLHGHSTAPK